MITAGRRVGGNMARGHGSALEVLIIPPVPNCVRVRFHVIFARQWVEYLEFLSIDYKMHHSNQME